jgi:hypothetical protein
VIENQRGESFCREASCRRCSKPTGRGMTSRLSNQQPGGSRNPLAASVAPPPPPYPGAYVAWRPKAQARPGLAQREPARKIKTSLPR